MRSITPYTQRRNYQWRGPAHSDDYNRRVEENFKDLAVLYNRISELEALNEETVSYFYKELVSLSEKIEDLEQLLDSYGATSDTLTFLSETQIETSNFDSEPQYAVAASQQCSFFNRYNLLTLPHIPSSSVSKIKYRNSDGTFATSGNLELLVRQDNSSLDNSSATVETSQPVYAIVGETGRIWHRNVITNTTDSNGTHMHLYIRIPDDLAVTADVNSITLDPFPIYGTDITEISYSTDPNVNLNGSATWTPLNNRYLYYNITEALGYTPPGAWEGDEALLAGPSMFLFPAKPITALRIGLRRKEYYEEGMSYVYSYGLSALDVRFEKFSNTGSAIIKFEAPTGSTISSVDSVTPQIWNVPEYLIPEVFTYEVIWETSDNSGIYTNSPVPLSKRIWLKVTLNKGPQSDQLPALSNIIVHYS